MIPQYFLDLAERTMDDMEFARQAFKSRIKEEWEQSKYLPRKKKKAKRKSLLIDSAIANYNILDYDYSEMKNLFKVLKGE
jgi:hypothetical protein